MFCGIIFIYWDRRQTEKFEKRKQLRKKEDEFWKKEDLFQKYKSWQGISQGKLGKAGDLLGVAGDEFSPGSLDTLYKP